MPGIGIMTDSNCGIMPSEERGYGIHVLPMPVIIDGKTFSEGVDITPDIRLPQRKSDSRRQARQLFHRCAGGWCRK